MGELGGFVVNLGGVKVSAPPPILSIFRRPIYYHPALARLVGDVAGAVFLSAIASYQGEIGEEQWWNRTSAQWEADTGLSLAQQTRIRERLRSLGVLEERPGVGQVPLSRVNVSRLMSLVAPQPSAAAPLAAGASAETEKKRSGFVPEDAILPFGLQHAEFEAAWRDWCKDRRERRRPLTQLAVKMQLAQLDGIATRHGWQAAVEAVRKSIERGWQTFYEPRVDGSPGAADQAPRSGEVPTVTRGAVEFARRRLIESAFQDANSGRISQAKLDQVLEAAKSADTMMAVDMIGRDIPSWSQGGAR
jgi:hypothetical protein